MFAPRNPHLFDNEYHSICFDISGIVFQIELVEGKHSPAQRVFELDTIGVIRLDSSFEPH
jgi:hypothetical protein